MYDDRMKFTPRHLFAEKKWILFWIFNKNFNLFSIERWEEFAMDPYKWYSSGGAIFLNPLHNLT